MEVVVVGESTFSHKELRQSRRVGKIQFLVVFDVVVIC